MGRMALLLVISLTLVVGLLGYGIQQRSSTAVESNLDYYKQTQARNAAAAAIYMSVRDLRANNDLNGTLPQILLQDVKSQLNGSTNSMTNSANKWAQAQVVIAAANSSRDTLVLSSSAIYDGVQSKIICARVYNMQKNPPQINGAVAVAYGSKAKISLAKESVINGLNWNLKADKLDATYPSTNGLSLGHIDQQDSLEIPVDPKTLKQLKLIKGKGSIDGDPNDIVVGQNQANYYDWARNIGSRADIVLRGKDVNKVTVWGTETDPKVVMLYGKTTINCDVTGYGILVVNGKLKIKNTAHFTYRGLIIAIGDSLHNEDVSMGNNTKIIGALLVAGKKIKVKMGGADVLYSYAALQKARAYIVSRSNYGIASWYE